MGAKIVFYDHEAGRYQCELLGAQFEGQNVRCKPENMDVLKAPDDADFKLRGGCNNCSPWLSQWFF
eukprot:1249818-Amphidinium_carterae.1